MLSRSVSRILRTSAQLQRSSLPLKHQHGGLFWHNRTLIAPPTPSTGPLMERRADRALPNVERSSRRWLRTMPLFLAIVGASTLAIFNYQKSSSSVVNSTLYALRINQQARDLLGDEIYFRDRVPWIWGTLNQLHGKIDIGFGVKGTKASGFMRFKSIRRTRSGYFETLNWSLETEDGTIINLLDYSDPFGNPLGAQAAV